MTVRPAQAFLLVEIRDAAPDSGIVRLDGPAEPYGFVLACGPDCKFVVAGDRILFLPDNMLGFEGSKNVIVPETAVFAKLKEDEVS